MKSKLLTFILTIASLIFIISCGDKKEENNNIPIVKKDTVLKDTVVKEPIVEEVIPEPIPEWPKTIVVKEGEWIYDIARREYGSVFAWRKIYEANQEKISNPDIIYPGQELLLPE